MDVEKVKSTTLVALLVALLFVVGWTTAFHVFEREFRPLVVLAHAVIGGAVAGTVVGYDVADRHHMGSDIKTEKERFEALFENAPSAMVDLQYDKGNASIQRANAEFEEMFGHASVDVEARDLFDVLSLANDTVEAAVADHVERGEVYETEVSLEGKSGGHYKLRVVPYEVGKAGSRAYALYTDVTELRETKRELESTVERLEASNDRLQQFAYIASHDLQEPARMVSSYMRLLESEYGDELDGEAREYMEFASEGADRMQAMIDGLLRYSRVRTDAEAFGDVPVDEVLAAVRQDLSIRIEETGASITTGELPVVDGDRQQLRQVFQNLLENAVDHGRMEPTIHVDCTTHPDEYVFSVSDDGPGIPETQQERVFELFKQGDRTADGTGIGLAICDRIVARHGGDIWVESDDGGGTTFFFSIPR